MKKKILTAALMTTLVATLSVGATLAYLSATTSEVKNTFVAGQIGDLTLGESTDDYEDENGNHCYVVVPGQKITKDPVVTFTYADDNNKDINQSVYVFATVSGTGWSYDDVNKAYTSKNVESTDADEAGMMSWTVAEGWTYLTEENGEQVFYRTVAADSTELSSGVSIISGDSITVSTDITKDNIEALSSAVSGLTFKAYAIQQATFNNDAVVAWNAVK